MANLTFLKTTIEEVLRKMKSNQLFLSKWDTAYFIIFLIVLGTLLLLMLVICLNCCCSPCCCCRCCCRCCCHGCHRCCCHRYLCCHHHSSRSQTMSVKQENSMGRGNLALEQYEASPPAPLLTCPAGQQ